MHFVSAIDSPFYQSEAFDRLLNFVARNPRRCQFREQNGKRLMTITEVPTIDEAVKLLASIWIDGLCHFGARLWQFVTNVRFGILIAYKVSESRKAIKEKTNMYN